MNRRYNSLRSITDRLKELRDKSAPYNCTFQHDIPTEAKGAVEANLKAQFELWWDSWIAPEIELLESRVNKSKGLWCDVCGRKVKAPHPHPMKAL